MASLARHFLIGLGLLLAVHHCCSQIDTCAKLEPCVGFIERTCVGNIKEVCLVRIITSACTTTPGAWMTCESSVPATLVDFQGGPQIICKTVTGGDSVTFGSRDGRLAGTAGTMSLNVLGHTDPILCTGYDTTCGGDPATPDTIRLTFTTIPCGTTTTTTTTTTTPTTTTTTTTPTTTPTPTTTTTSPTTTTAMTVPPQCTCTESTAIGSCSTTCGPGIQTHQLICSGTGCNPPIVRTHAGACPGTRPTCVRQGGWTSWVPVSVGCGVTCGEGVVSRTRSCTNPIPLGGGTCPGVAVDVIACFRPACPVRPTNRPGRRGTRRQPRAPRTRRLRRERKRRRPRREGRSGGRPGRRGSRGRQIRERIRRIRRRN